MNTKAISNIWCVSVFCIIAVALHLFFIRNWFPGSVIFYILVTFLFIIFIENKVHDAYRLFYLPSNNYQSRCQPNKKYVLPISLLTLGFIFCIKMYLDTKLEYYFAVLVFLFPSLIYIYAQILFYKYQIRTCIHLSIIYDSYLFFDKLKWSLIDHEENPDKIVLVCYFKNYLLNGCLQIIKAKLSKRGYLIKTERSNCYAFKAIKDSKRYLISIEQTECEFEYVIKISSIM